jgi:electron transport complex protein RnfG
MRKDIVRYAITLVLFCGLASGALAFTYAGTLPKIVAQAKAEEEKACRVVMPGVEFAKRDDKAEAAAQQFPAFMGQGNGKVFEGMKDGKMVGVVIQLASRGYGGPVKLAVGIKDGKVIGFVVIEHKETAGLGSKIKDDPAFAKQFVGKTIADPIEPRKDIDTLTGATKSTKAVTNGVRAALQAYQSLYGGVSK